jgi:uncharacterized membrane protein (UPF0182 family)
MKLAQTEASSLLPLLLLLLLLAQDSPQARPIAILLPVFVYDAKPLAILLYMIVLIFDSIGYDSIFINYFFCILEIQFFIFILFYFILFYFLFFYFIFKNISYLNSRSFKRDLTWLRWSSVCGLGT